MSQNFIENGVSSESAFASNIVAAIRNAKSVDIAVSYLQMSGWFILQRELKNISAAKVRILTTDQMNVTQPAALSAALHAGFKVKCYSGNRVFHPKVYLFHGIKKVHDIAIVGSANISSSGLQNGVEAGIRISDPVIFNRLVPWFEALFNDEISLNINDAFVRDYTVRWNRTSKIKFPLRRMSKAGPRTGATTSPEDLDTLDDAFSTLSSPVGTLGFDHAANNIRNLSRLMEVLAAYPVIGDKERSELRLLGFIDDGSLSALGIKARSCRTEEEVARVWCSWVRKTPDVTLDALNVRLKSFKHAANRFWSLKPEVQKYFFREMHNHSERRTLQAIELCCNGSNVVKSLSLDDFRAMAGLIHKKAGPSEYVKHAFTDYLKNKGGRSWKGDDRRIVLSSWK